MHDRIPDLPAASARCPPPARHHLRRVMATQGAVGEVKTEDKTKGGVKTEAKPTPTARSPEGKEAASPTTPPPPSSQYQELGARPKTGLGARPKTGQGVRPKAGQRVRPKAGQGRQVGARERQEGREECKVGAEGTMADIEEKLREDNSQVTPVRTKAVARQNPRKEEQKLMEETKPDDREPRKLIEEAKKLEEANQMEKEERLQRGKAEERERRREEVRSSLLPGVRCRRLGCQEGLITGSPSTSFTRVRCRSRCSTYYHPACWEAARRELVGRGRERECLGLPCSTPDCQAVITRWCATPRLQVIPIIWHCFKMTFPSIYLKLRFKTVHS